MKNYFEDCYAGIGKKTAGKGYCKYVWVDSYENLKAMKRDWYKFCSFNEMLDWLSSNKDLEVEFKGQQKLAYDKDPEFADFIHEKDLDKFFNYDAEARRKSFARIFHMDMEVNKSEW